MTTTLPPTTGTEFEPERVCAVVVTEGDAPVGFVTGSDVGLAVIEGANIGTEPVKEVVIEDPVTLQEDDESMTISRPIGEANGCPIPVVDNGGELSGTVTLGDLVAAIGE